MKLFLAQEMGYCSSATYEEKCIFVDCVLIFTVEMGGTSYGEGCPLYDKQVSPI